MRIKPELQAEYENYVQMNDDPYSAATVRYGEAWASVLETRIPEDATEPQIVGILVRDDFGKKASHEADTEGITGFMYGCAAQSIARFTPYGEAFRKWFNKETQLGDEGERANETGGILNPAVLNIGR